MFVPIDSLAFGLPAEWELFTPVWAGRGYSVALSAELLAGVLLMSRLRVGRGAPWVMRGIVCASAVVGLVALNIALNVWLLAVLAQRAKGTGAPFW